MADPQTDPVPVAPETTPVKAEKPAPLNTLRKTKAEKPITVTFVGDPRGANAGFKANDPDPAIYGDKEFPKGKPVTVDDSTWIAQYGKTLRKNSHFTVE